MPTAHREFLANLNRLAEDFAGEAVRFEELFQHLHKADIVLSSTGAPHIIIGPKEDQDKVAMLLDKLDQKSPQAYLSTVIGELTLDRASMQGIKEWGLRNPAKLTPLLDENPSYVFFREVPGATAPRGVLDVPGATLGKFERSNLRRPDRKSVV